MQHSDRQRTALLIAGLLILLLLALSVWAWSSASGLPEDGMSQGREATFTGESVAIADDSDVPQAELTREAVTARSTDLATTGSMRIELNYADGEPAADLLLLILDAAVYMDTPTTPRLEGRSDRDGILVHKDLSPGSYQVLVVQPIASEGPIKIVAGEETSVVIEFAEGYAISGKVVDRQDRPVAGANIWAGRFTWSAEPCARSDAAGRFRLRAVRGNSGIGASAKGYAPSPMRQLNANPGAELEIKLVLQGPGGAVRGRVISHDGNSVPGALVTFPNRGLSWTFTGKNSDYGLISLRTLCDAKGEFLVTGLPPTTIPVEVQAKGHGGIKDQVTVTAGGTVQVLLQLKDSGSLHGRVLSGAGEPIANIRIFASPYERPGTSVRTQSDDDGFYRLDDLTSGPIRLVARNNDRLVRDVVLVEESVDLEHDIRFPSGEVIEGRVLDHHGEPLAGWTIDSWSPGQDRAGARSDEQGHFLLQSLAPGKAYRLRIRRPRQGFHCHVVTSIMAGRRDLTIRIPAEAMAEGSIRGRLTDWQGNAIAGMTVLYSQSPAQGQGSMLSKEDGGFVIAGLPEGRYSIIVMSGGHLRYLPEIVLAPGEDLDLGEIREGQRGSLSLSLRIPQGSGVGQVIFFDKGRKPSGGAKLEGGALQDYPMSPGKHYLRVGGTVVSSRMHEFSIASGQETTLMLDLQSGSPVVLTFMVDLSLIEPGEMIDLQVIDDERRLFGRESLGFLKDHFRHNGNYPPGTYTFVAHYGNSLLSEGKFEVEAASVGSKTFSFTLR